MKQQCIVIEFIRYAMVWSDAKHLPIFEYLVSLLLFKLFHECHQGTIHVATFYHRPRLNGSVSGASNVFVFVGYKLSYWQPKPTGLSIAGNTQKRDKICSSHKTQTATLRYLGKIKKTATQTFDCGPSLDSQLVRQHSPNLKLT